MQKNPQPETRARRVRHARNTGKSSAGDPVQPYKHLAPEQMLRVVGWYMYSTLSENPACGAAASLVAVGGGIVFEQWVVGHSAIQSGINVL